MRFVGVASLLVAGCVTEPIPTDGSDTYLTREVAEAATEHDLELIAAARGWTLAEARFAMDASEAIGRVSHVLAETAPEAFVGSMVSEDPRGAPTLFVKGPAGPLLGDLLAAEEIEIVVADHQPYSFDELLEHLELITRTFQEQEINASVAIRVELEGRIDVLIPDDAGLDASAAFDLVPSALRDRVHVALTPATEFRDLTAFGGMTARHFYVPNTDCTTGWSVRHRNTGIEGVTTAGHCTVNQTHNPAQGWRTLVFQESHNAFWGDIQWLQELNNINRPDDFFADASTIRDVSSVEPLGGLSIGESVCFYGRSSNQRDCTLTVAKLGTCGGATVVYLNGKGVALPADSGGGVSVANKAYGSIKGLCGANQLTFSIADLYDEALNVDVMTTP